MSLQTETFEAPRPPPDEEEPRPRQLARGSSRVVANEITRGLPRRESPRELTMRGVARRDSTILAVALLAAYLGQAVMQLEVPWLAALQANDVYKLATGGVLVGFLAVQWVSARKHRELHLWLGACAPVALYAHATKFAFGYLAWLSVIYLGVGAVGLVHRPIIARRARRLYVAWVIAHVALSTLLLVLVAYHIVIAIAYE